MIVKHSTKADECAAFASFMASAEFERLPERTRRNAIARRRGLEGERSTAHILDRHFHNSQDHVLLHDLRLPDGIGGFAQFDHIILSRLSRTATVVEVKNYSGRLSKNQHDEWLVWYEGRRRPIDIPNPLAQARRQREVLRAWFKAQKHDLAFEKIGAFVIIPSDCSIDRSKVGSDVAIYKADNFIAAWAEFGGISPLGRLFSSGVAAKSLMAIAQQLAASHQPDPRTFEDLVGLPSRMDDHPSTTVLAAETGSAAEPEVDPPSDVELGSVPDAPEDAEPMCTAIEVVEAEPVAPVEAVTATPAPSNPIRGGKASTKIEVVPGIHERALPDGRIAFLSDETDGAGDRLKSACDGLGRWNPRYRNWLTDPDQAAVVRETLLTKHQERSSVAAERSPATANQHAREA